MSFRKRLLHLCCVTVFCGMQIKTNLFKGGIANAED